jgi:hypothetical protein
MDTYLEGPLWTSVHSQLAVEIARQLTPLLVPKYAALTERRIILATPEVEDGITIAATHFRPDAAIVTAESEEIGAAAAVATIAPPLQMQTAFPEPIPQLSVEIRDSQNLQLVTAIEVISPWNKTGSGYSEYVEKRRKLLLSTAHLVEIDLLRTGQRVPMRGEMPAAQYFVYVGRANRRPVTDVWPIRLQEPLPNVPIPLLAGDPDVILNLQQALTNVYDGFGYRYLVDYRHPPKIPLDEGLREWAEQRIKSQGILQV